MAITLRPVALDDLPALVELHRRADAADGVPRNMTLAELREALDDDQVVLAADTRVAELDGTLAGYVHTYHLPSTERQERCYVFGRVDPDRRRQGCGTALQQWALARATEQLQQSDHALPRYVRAEAPSGAAATQALLADSGMTPVRANEDLLRPLTDLPARPSVAGLDLRRWPDGRDDEIRQVKDAAFADHWGSAPTTPERWQQIVHGHGSRLDLSFVAVDADDRIVAFASNCRFEEEDEVVGRRDGWIEGLGTLREWRGRGVASALLTRSLHAFAAEGLTHAAINVDTENPTGAARLYRALGFRPWRRTLVYELEVS